ncbi:MAG TPA: sulfatase-like hydrolase/transferase [Thermoanaerobaculia bacterium]|nr:sulfatase-like hydrolase/transferase [Thermoanaerobaculia bacterium]HUM29868.1 sulfatase-like hydrolase/transferase [Thermoanaerobaculia bacterium]HXK68143.1 sulfatase-like hydrolase/transferase [Thermoanaerobaculia bacterium]
MKRFLFLLLFAAPLLFAKSPNIIVITMDTTRADHLSSYGYGKPTSPFIDSLAEKGVRFEQALCSVPTTLPSHTNMFSGLYPFHTKVRHNLLNAVPEDVILLSQRLKSSGYSTSAVIGSLILHERFGLARGFDVYDQSMDEGKNQRKADVVTDRSIELLKSMRSPFFLWTHYYDPHHPYNPPPPFDKDFSDPYDGEIAYTDSQIKRLIQAIPESQRRNTLIFILGDHGEGLGDHGEEEHGVLLYNSTVHVPFIVYGEGVTTPHIVDTAVSITSLTPTILEAAGLSIGDQSFDVPSLWSSIQGKNAPAEWYYLETFLPYYSFDWAPIRGITNGRWKYLESPREELFDLEHDPGELKNIIEKKPEILSRLKTKISEVSPEPYGGIVETAPVELPPEELKKLQSLGYLQGGKSPSSKPARDLPDPKDLVDISHKIIILAPELMDERKFEELEPMMLEVLRRDRQNVSAMKFLASAYIGQNKLTEAERVLTKADKLSPNTYYILTKLGVVYYKQGDLRKGLDYFEKSYRLNQYNIEVLGYYAQALIMDKKKTEAMKVLAFATENNLVDGNTEVARGLIHMEDRDLNAALAAFQKAIELSPNSVIAYANLGYLYHLKRQPQMAIKMLDEAYALEPDNRKTIKAMIGILLELGRVVDARMKMQEYIRKFPNAPDVPFVQQQLNKLNR